MPFDLSCPTPATRIFGEIELEAMACPQPRCIGASGDEFGAVQVEVAFTGAFFRQPQTMAEFEFGLQKVALQPIDCALWKALIADDLGRGSGDRRIGFQHGLIVGEHRFIADTDIDHRHVRALMPKHVHDRLHSRPAFGEFRADRMAEAMRRDEILPFSIDQAESERDVFEGIIEQVVGRDCDTAAVEEQLDVLSSSGIWNRAFVRLCAQGNHPAKSVGSFRVKRRHGASQASGTMKRTEAGLP